MILQRFSSVKLCLRSVRTVLYKENDLSTSTDRAGQYFKQAASLIFLPSGRLPSFPLNTADISLNIFSLGFLQKTSFTLV